jgi:acetylornithine/succinyldiaminopimelate/putrescine aminotransferase
MASRKQPQRFLARNEPPELQIGRSKGSYVFDAKGIKYVDFLMGWCVGNFGWGNAVIEKAARQYKGPDYVYPHFDYPPWEDLAFLLVSMAPPGLGKCFRATGGSEAMDLALQAAMLHTGRGKFMSIEDSYHGNTLGTLSIGASKKREKLRNLLPNCLKVDAPLDEKLLGSIETQLKKRDVAAFIMEPIGMNLGVLIPEEGFLPELQRLCRMHGTLLVMDEVATGFGRTGTLFASDQYDLQPDIVTVAKSITDGVGGMGAMIATQEVARSMEEDGAFYSTYGWHPRSTAVAITTLKYIIRNEKKLVANVTATAQYFAMRLAAMRFRHDVEVRQRGLAIGLDFGDKDYAEKVGEKCRRKGLLVSPEGETVLLIPALDIDHKTAQKGLDILEACV